MTPCTVDLSMSTVTLLTSTTTDDATEPSSILNSSDVVEPMRIEKSALIVRNPSCSSVSWYSPGARSGTTTIPSEVPAKSVRLPRSLLTTVALTSETVLPDGSKTCTDNDPVNL